MNFRRENIVWLNGLSIGILVGILTRKASIHLVSFLFMGCVFVCLLSLALSFLKDKKENNPAQEKGD